MPTILSRLRGLVAPSTPDQPLRLADAGGVVVTPGSSSSGSGGGGRKGDDGDRGRLGARGRKGGAGAAGAAGQGRPPGAYWATPGGGVVLVPVNSVEVFINGPCTIQAVRVATKGGTGSCTLTFWKSNFISGHYPPIVTDDITGGANVVLSSGTSYADSVLSGWSTSLTTDDCILIGLPSSANFTSIAVALRVG